MGVFEDIRERILVLDGAMGTLLQQGMSEEEILRAYVDAGADIITTNSFNANRISLAEQGQAGMAASLACEAAARARAESQLDVFRSYGVDQKQLLENAKLLRRGKYLFYAVGEAADAWEDAFLSAIR